MKERKIFGLPIGMMLTIRIVFMALIVIFIVIEEIATIRGEGFGPAFHFFTVAVLALMTQIAVDYVKKARKFSQLRDSNLVVARENQDLHETLQNLDIQTREEIGSWLHSDVQGRIIAMSRACSRAMAEIFEGAPQKFAYDDSPQQIIEQIRKLVKASYEEFTEQMDQFAQDVVRKKAHEMFPPLLAVSLHLALENLVANRATLKIDSKLDFQEWNRNAIDENHLGKQIKSALEDRLILNRQTRYVLYRCVEEGLTNAEKQQATAIEVAIEVDDKNSFIECRVISEGTKVPDKVQLGLGLRVVAQLVAGTNGTWSLYNYDAKSCLHVNVPLSGASSVPEWISDNFVKSDK